MSAPKLLPGMKPAQDAAVEVMDATDGEIACNYGDAVNGMQRFVEADRAQWAAEVERLRAETAAYESWEYFVGPCAHGSDPWTRCDECGAKKAPTVVRDALDGARAEVERLRAALLEVSTDLAQDSLERGEGAATDEAAGFRRISPRTTARVAAAIAGAAR